MNAIERLRERGLCPANDMCDPPNPDSSDCAGCLASLDALAAVEALYQAAKARAGERHSDTCASVIGLDQPWECTCGHDALAAAVRRVEGE